MTLKIGGETYLAPSTALLSAALLARRANVQGRQGDHQGGGRHENASGERHGVVWSSRPIFARFGARARA